MAFCLPSDKVNKLKRAFLSGELRPDKLQSLSSEEIRNLLKTYLGESEAREVNKLFESKLLLKNQQRGIINWAKKVTSDKQETLRKNIVEKAMALENALDITSAKGVLEDIASARLGLAIDKEVAENIVNFTNRLKSLYNPNIPKWQQNEEYIKTEQQLFKYLRSQKLEAFNPKTVIGKIKIMAQAGLSFQRALLLGQDLSAAFNQGRAYIGTKRWREAFWGMLETIKNPLKIDELEVEFLSSPYRDEIIKYRKDLGLTILGERPTQREELYVDTLASKIPFLKRTEAAFEYFVNYLRGKRFIDIVNNLMKSGINITEDKIVMKELAQAISAATLRGNLGNYEQVAGSLSTILMSPRTLVARPQMVLNVIRNSGPAKKESAMALARLLGTIVAIEGIYAMARGEVELDSTKSDFLKVKIGNTRFDPTMGFSSLIVLMSRIAKDFSQRGNRLYKPKFGQRDSLDLVVDFFLNKASPLFGLIRDELRNEGFAGAKLTPEYIAQELLVPMSAQDTIEAFNESGGDILTTLVAGITSILGIPTQTYQSSRR